MTSLSLKQTQHGITASRETAVSAFLPYTRHVDDTTIATKDGYLFQVIALDGIAFETADQSTLNHLKGVRNTLWRSIASSRHALYHHVIRRKVNDYPSSNFSGFCKELDQRWAAKLAEKQLFVNDLYLTVVRRSLTGSVGVADALGRLISTAGNRAAMQNQRKADLKALNEATDNVISSLARYGARRLSVYETDSGAHSQVLEFLSYLVNLEQRPVRLPTMPLDVYLPYKRPLFGHETLELRGASRQDTLFGAMISIKEYGPGTGAGMLDALLRLPHELIITQTFAFIDKQKSLESLQQAGRIMDTAEDAAVSQREQLLVAADDLAGGRIHFGEHHLTCLVTGNNEATLDRAVSSTVADLTDLGLIAVREDLNAEACFWAQMPGNFSFIARKAAISSANFAGYASFHNFPRGKATGNHWGECVTMLETTSGTPYAFNFHHADVGNFTVIGPSGSGKTVVLTFLMAQAQRFDPFSVYFDKDRGAELFIRAIGGQYSVVRPGHPTGFNPLQLPDTPVNRAFLRDWLAQLVRPLDGTPLTSTEVGIIADAVDANYLTTTDNRRLGVLQELFKGHERPTTDSLAARLNPWWGGGERAWLFDNPEDKLQFDQRTTGFDLTFILDDAVGRTPTMMYLFHRVDQMLTGQKAIIFIDEGWKALDHPVFEERIKDWLKTIRKRNGLIGFGSQSAKDALSSRIGDSIIEQSPTQLFMPNHKADRAAYCEGFGLSDEEYRTVKELPDTSRCFLIKHGSHSVVARLDLSGEDDLLAILSGREETVALLDKIRAEVGDDPADWLPLFHQRRSS
ncbi:MAG: VirB4 family type IV secretion/conjugal transfer ATPase [Proteobacteria bacterium]|nr:VirB4 family type IV secretion/conjugal transfer ATPase [Pseudomonadota bacterium]